MKGDVTIVLILMSIFFLFIFIAMVGIGIVKANPVMKSLCDDGKDNDNDNLIDKEDPGCHTDFDASNDASWDRNHNDESSEKKTKICRKDEDCLNEKDGTKCLMIYPGDFIPFCGCMKSSDCTSGNCGPNNKCS